MSWRSGAGHGAGLASIPGKVAMAARLAADARYDIVGAILLHAGLARGPGESTLRFAAPNVTQPAD